MMRGRAPFALAAAALCGLAAAARCSGKEDGPGVKSAAPPPTAVVAASGSDPAAPGSDDETTFVSPVPLGLVDCSAATAKTYVDDEVQAEDVVACLLRDGAKNRLDPSAYTVHVKLKDGSEPAAAAVAKTVKNAPWQIGFNLKRELVAAVAEIAVDYEAQGVKGTAKTTSTAFDWRSDPLFQEIVSELIFAAAVADPRATLPFDADGLITQFKNPANSIAFVTDTLYRVDFGAANADALCAAGGAKIPYPGPWVAVLSTSARDARDKVKIIGQVFGFEGKLIAHNEATFWSGKPEHSVIYTESGQSIVSVPAAGVDPPAHVQLAWTGSKTGGVYDAAAGACADWSSAAAEQTGFAQDMSEFDAVVGVARPCARVARLLCISQMAAAGPGG